MLQFPLPEPKKLNFRHEGILDTPTLTDVTKKEACLLVKVSFSCPFSNYQASHKRTAFNLFHHLENTTVEDGVVYKPWFPFIETFQNRMELIIHHIIQSSITLGARGNSLAKSGRPNAGETSVRPEVSEESEGPNASSLWWRTPKVSLC